jgi:hypothetical protein
MSLASMPFGAAPADFAAAAHRPARQLVDFDDGRRHLVYTGRCGPDMSLVVTVVFRAFHRFLESRPDRAAQYRVHFISTDYAPPPLRREWAMPVARTCGVAAYVAEHCYRVPYFEALHYIQRAHGMVVVGSNDRTYSASKLFPFVLARRPLLVVFHRESKVLNFARNINVGQRYAFADPRDIDPLAADVWQHWFVDAAAIRPAVFDEAKFHPFTAESLAGELAGVFARAAIGRAQPSPILA